MPPGSTLWPLEAHTRGKHLVLREYLNAWLPILGQSQNRVLFVDAFAGPGEYEDGEEGSPLIALQTLKNHRAYPRIKDRILFKFIEKDPDRAAHLENLLRERGYLTSFDIEVINLTFTETLTGVLDHLDESQQRLGPALVMIDPFGVSGTPMNVVERILRNPQSEIYVSFMYEPMRRFMASSEFEPHLDSLFGSGRWREALDMSHNPQGQRDFLQGLYASQLREAGAQYVVHFELYDGNRHIYTIFFGTKNRNACDLMKQSIWKVAPLGNYQFRGAKVGQLAFEGGLVDTKRLEADLQNRFGNEKAVRIERLEEFVKSDETDFHSGHLKTKTLKPMEDAGRLEVVSSSRKRRGAFPAGTTIRFIS